MRASRAASAGSYAAYSVSMLRIEVVAYQRNAPAFALHGSSTKARICGARFTAVLRSVNCAESQPACGYTNIHTMYMPWRVYSKSMCLGCSSMSCDRPSRVIFFSSFHYSSIPLDDIKFAHLHSSAIQMPSRNCLEAVAKLKQSSKKGC